MKGSTNQDSLKLNHSAEEFYSNGVAKGNLKDFKGANAYFTKAIEINTEYALSYYNRGLAYFTLGQKKKGCLDYIKAGKLGFDIAIKSIKKYFR